MSIRPIDFLTMPNKSQEASQLHTAQNQKLQHATEQANVSFTNTIKHNSQQTVKMEKSEYQETRYDAKEEGRGQKYKKQGKKQGKKEEEKTGNVPKLHHKFDMKI